MRNPDLYISEQHASSRRYAIFEDDGRCGWLYLTAPNEPRPVADVWVYNRLTPSDRADGSGRSRPPPILSKFATHDAVVGDPARSAWRFRWSADGGAVALGRDGTIVALVVAEHRRGHSLAISQACPWGSPLSAEQVAAAGVG